MNALIKNPAALAPLLFLILFPAFWCFVVWIISILGGWARLGRDYTARNKPLGPDFSMLSLQIAPMTGYNNCLQVTFCAQGIYMVPFLIFRVGHPPLLIPWSKVGPIQTRNFLWMRTDFFPIEVAGKSLKLYLKSNARQWIEQNPNYRDFAPRFTGLP
ncbi:hypothetical protein [Haloferula sp. BvORR071]|uniref:hypothetical protein n=1 Tax=Haloferula sp. BvORR071 TaxID=1396141 RepID=UPI00054FA3D9|nr:hypothetical protein [Haloferula sp. BvORR071]